MHAANRTILLLVAVLFVAVVYLSSRIPTVGVLFHHTLSNASVSTARARASMRAIRFLPVLGGRREYRMINANVHTRWRALGGRPIGWYPGPVSGIDTTCHLVIGYRSCIRCTRTYTAAN
jgi:hypothetical protein